MIGDRDSGLVWSFGAVKNKTRRIIAPRATRPNATNNIAFIPVPYSLILYFFRNLSIRPAVSTNFCLPVKNGWQAEQISTLMFLIVERV